MTKKNKPRVSLVGFYRRKILFFLMIFAFSFFGYKIIVSNQFNADETPINLNKKESSASAYNIILRRDGSITIDGKEYSNKVNFFDDYDELRLLVIENPGSYLEEVQIRLTLPSDISGEVSPELLAIHGVGYTDVYKRDSRTIEYQATNVSPTASLSIVAKMPKGTITPTIVKKTADKFASTKNTFWLIIAIALPILSLLMMLSLIIYQRKRQKIEIPDKEISTLPMAVPPAVVGVLFNQKVGSREIASTLVDLAYRGDIAILEDVRGFSFGKGRFDTRLLGYEKVLLSKIFQESLSSDRQEIERRINNHFYSKKISLVSSGIYGLATMLGYFKINPQKSHAKYKFIGIGFFLLGLAGFILSLMYFTEPQFVVFFWVGMMAASLIITVVAKNLPIRTMIGQEVLSNWLAFRKFLSNPEKIPFSEDNQMIFQKYLSYAIALNCEAAWAKRFSEHNFTIPDWFMTEKTGLSLEDFCLSLFPIISYVGRSFAALREPGFE